MPESLRDRVRVAFVSDSMPERNGVGAYYTDLIEQLDPQRFEVEFACPGRVPARLRFPLPGDATQRVHLPSPRRIGALMRRLKPHVIVVATPGPWGMLGLRWARKLGARLLVGYHTDYAGVTDLYGHSLLRVLSRRYFRRVDRLLFRHAERVLGNSEAMVDQARAQGARAAERIGTLVPKLLLDTPPQPVREQVEAVLFAGRLAHEKRIAEVLEAAGSLSGIRFVIAGDGPLREAVEHAAARLDNLEYVGWQTRAGLLDYFDRSDALLLPSEFESFGNVALEAMARQRVALVTRTCGIANWPELARHLQIIDAERPLARAISGFATVPFNERAERARAARQAAMALNRDSLGQWERLLRAAPGDA